MIELIPLWYRKRYQQVYEPPADRKRIDEEKARESVKPCPSGVHVRVLPMGWGFPK